MPPPPQPSPLPPSPTQETGKPRNLSKNGRAGTLLAGLLLVTATVAAYSNTLRCPFIFDDMSDIVENSSIRQLWPIWRPLAVTSLGKTSVHSRPVVNFSFAVNYATGGLSPLHYHLTNLAIHALAGLTLMGIVRRTLSLPSVPQRYARAAAPLALTIALIWTLHPLQTEAVTYVTQRFESMMGLFYFLSLYSVIRGASSHHSLAWSVAAVTACLLAMGCKEVAVSVPIVILLYDRAFLAGSLDEAWSRRRGLYMGLAATWVAFAVWFVLSASRSTWAGYSLPISATDYAQSQFGVILHYLRLSFWPYPQVFDYGWPVARTAAEIIPAAIAVLGLLAATCMTLARWPKWGTLGAWFFLILAPTSSVLPIADLAFEHRMYLSLAAVVTAAVIAAYEILERLFASFRAFPWATACLQAGLAMVVLVALGSATYARNRVYESWQSLWQDVFDTSPKNPRAQCNLGLVLWEQGKVDEAVAFYREALELRPNFSQAHYNLATALSAQGKLDEAIVHYQKALEPRPMFSLAHYGLANSLAAKGKIDEAIDHYRKALQIAPQSAEAHIGLAGVLGQRGEMDEAVSHCREALAIQPQSVEAHHNLASILARQGRLDEAIGHYEEAIRINPSFAEARFGLGRAFYMQGKRRAAIRQWDDALRLRPRDIALLDVLAWEYATCPKDALRNGAEALRLAQRAVQLAGGQSPQLLDTLGAAYAETGQFPEAVRTAQRAVEFASQQGQPGMANSIRVRLKLYEAGAAFRDVKSPLADERE